MKKFFFPVVLLALTGLSMVANATKRIVDLNGGGQFTSIQAAIDASSAGDTVKVWPGSYNEQLSLNKAILLMGSGYENTIIIGNSWPLVVISNSGIMQWFTITSLGGDGVKLIGGTIRNCIARNCTGIGILGQNSGVYSYVQNCTSVNNGSYGVYCNSGGNLQVVNCISRNNGNTGFRSDGASGFWVLYSNGSRYNLWTDLNNIDTDPLFTSTSNGDYHILSSSPSWNTGNPSLFDPDGSRSDMGYFGGPNCPIMPVVYSISGAPNGSNTNITAKARANY